jgi:hypothetical protein
LIHCFAGCKATEITAALGLKASDLFAGRTFTSPSPTLAVRRTAPGLDPRHAPPQDEVQHVWEFCRPVDEDAEVVSWLDARKLEPLVVAHRNLCRALPPGIVLPRWARCVGRQWALGGYRVVLPMYDAAGKLASLHARNVRGARPKGALPAGYSARGLVFADNAGIHLLKAGELGPPAVWITEGVPDYLSCATAWSEGREERPAVLGIVAGAWTPRIARPFPIGARVVIAVHHDPTGQHYLDNIARSLAGRCKLERWMPNGVAS